MPSLTLISISMHCIPMCEFSCTCMHHALILHCLISGHALLALVCLVQLANCDSSSDWQVIVTQQCVNESLAVQATESRSDIECMTEASKLSGLLIAQFNSDTRQCSVFHYQSVCHLIDAAASSAHHIQHSCTVYASHKTIKFMNLSNKLNETLSTKFQGVWVMSDDASTNPSRNKLLEIGKLIAGSANVGIKEILRKTRSLNTSRSSSSRTKEIKMVSRIFDVRLKICFGCIAKNNSLDFCGNLEKKLRSTHCQLS